MSKVKPWLTFGAELTPLQGGVLMCKVKPWLIIGARHLGTARYHILLFRFTVITGNADAELMHKGTC